MKRCLLILFMFVACFTTFKSDVYASSIESINQYSKFSDAKLMGYNSSLIYILEDADTGDEDLLSDWNLCANDKAMKVFKFIGNILTVVFIFVPILLIVLGSIDFVKAIVAGKEDDIKKAQSAFIKRILAAIIVFLVPVISKFVMSIITQGPDVDDAHTSNCLTCILDPSSC